MSVQGIESVVGAVWQAQQTAPGRAEIADATGVRMLRKHGDDGLRAAITQGSSEYVDGRLYGSPTLYVARVGGEVGTVTVQGQLDVIGFQAALLLAEDVVTGSADPWTHTMRSGAASPLDMTLWQTVGRDVGPVAQCFYDARCSRWALSGQTDEQQQTLTAVSTIMALNAAEWAGTLPTARDSGDDPILFPQGVTRIGGVALAEVRSTTLDIDTGLSTIAGQSTAPVGWDTSNKGAIVHTADGVVTDQTLPVLLRALYGTDTPTGGTKLASRVITTSIVQTYVIEAGRRELTISTPRVVIDPGDITLAPRAEGGTIDFTLGGRALEDAGAILTVTIRSGVEDPYVTV